MARKVVLISLIASIEVDDGADDAEVEAQINGELCADLILATVLEANDEADTCSCMQMYTSVIGDRSDFGEDLPSPAPMRVSNGEPIH